MAGCGAALLHGARTARGAVDIYPQCPSQPGPLRCGAVGGVYDRIVTLL